MSAISTLLLTCRRLFISKMEVMVQIGIHEFEKNAPQRLHIDIDLFVPIVLSTPQQDSINEVVDYDFVRQVVMQRVAKGAIGLQETLVDDLLTSLLEHPQVIAARVVSCKPDVYADCVAVGVETFRHKAQ
jgi:dihydroneopterin aldolase